MLENNFNKNFKKWIPHKDVDEVYNMEDAGFVRDEGFVVLLTQIILKKINVQNTM